MASIHLKTSMLIPGVHTEDFPLTLEVGTVRALMNDVGRRMNLNLFKEDNDLIDFLDVKLNGRKIDFFHDSVDTALEDGDQLLIRLVPIGGG